MIYRSLQNQAAMLPLRELAVKKLSNFVRKLRGRKKVKASISLIAGGNFLELYDFTLYGYFAPVIAQLFFPSDSQLVSMLATFFAFTLGFVVRPLGAIIFGHIGDMWSRRAALTLSLGLMGVSSLMIALLPGYKEIGILAPAALLFFRVLQGLSMSGEVAGTLVSLMERASPGRQALMSSLVHVSGISGMVVGSLVATFVHYLLMPDAVAAWGWRTAYLAGAICCIVLAGLRLRGRGFGGCSRTEYIRSELTPTPVIVVCRSQKMAMVRVGVLNLLNGACFFMVFIYINTFWSEQLHLDRVTALAINTGNMLLMVLMIPVAGWISDRVGTLKVLQRAVIAGLVVMVPCYWLMTGPEWWKMIVGQLGYSVLLAFIYGSGAVLSARLLPKEVRMTGLALGYNTAQGFFGSLSPVIATWLVGVTGIAVSPILYLLMVYLAGLALLWQLD